jgi:hypothetical protein
LSKIKLHLFMLFILKDLAPQRGFEPRFTAPKAAVLPLDDRGKNAGSACSNQCNPSPANWREPVEVESTNDPKDVQQF